MMCIEGLLLKLPKVVQNGECRFNQQYIGEWMTFSFGLDKKSTRRTMKNGLPTLKIRTHPFHFNL